MKLSLTPAERAALRSQAHALNPVVMIGGDGLTPAVLKEINAALNSHELIKVRVLGDDRIARNAINETVCEELGAAPVQHIGKLLVLYRPRGEAPTSTEPTFPLGLPRGVGLKGGKAPQQVLLIKPSKSGRRAPSRTKIMLLGNERVSPGGLIKRVKERLKSVKKRG